MDNQIKWKLELEDIEEELKTMKGRCERDGRKPTEKELRKAERLLDRADELDELLGNETAADKLRMILSDPDDSYGSQGRRIKGPFKSMGEQVQAIIRAGTPGQSVDPRLHQVRAATGLSEGAGADGGFLLQTEFSYDLIKGAFDTGFLASKVTKFTIGENKNSIQLPALDETSRATGSRWGGIRLYHVSEASEKTKSKPKFRRLELNLKKLVGVCYMTDELIWDVPTLEQYLKQGFSEEYGYMLDDIILSGTGAGQGLGVLSSASLVSQDAEGGQGSTIIWDNIRKMWSRLLPKCRKNALWCVGIDAEPELWNLSMAVGTGGGPIFQPATGAAGAPFGTLMGRPIFPMEQCSALGTVGDIVLMDPSWVVMADKSIRTDISIHLRFLFDEQILRMVYRYDLEPILASAITPASGGPTLSSHVALATR